MDKTMTTEEIKAHLTSEDENVAAAAVIYVTKERDEMQAEIDALHKDIEERDKADENAFIEDLKAQRKLAPKDDETEQAMRSMFRSDRNAARVLAARMTSEKEQETANVAAGKATDGKDERTLAEMMDAETH